YARYRLRILANHGEPSTQLAEIELLGRPPVPASGATASEACAPHQGAARAIDGTGATQWCSSQEPNLVVDLGDACEVNQVMVRHAGAGGEPAELNTRDFTVSVS